MLRGFVLSIPPYPGKEKPRSPRCFKPGDLIFFKKENEMGVLIRRFDLHEKHGQQSKLPSWCWEMVFSTGKNIPWGYDFKHGISEINLYNTMGWKTCWIPKEKDEGRRSSYDF